MKRRKGWHRPKRNKMPVRYPMQVANRALARAGLPRLWADADREMNPLLAEFDAEVTVRRVMEAERCGTTAGGLPLYAIGRKP